jgi:hypothetical protein
VMILLVVEEGYRTRESALSTARLQNQHGSHRALMTNESSSESIEVHVPSVDRSSDAAVNGHGEFQCRVLLYEILL